MKEVEVKEISVREYVASYRDVPRFMEFCRQCGNYGNLWACPPFDFDVDELIGRWRTAMLVAVSVDVPKGSAGSAYMGIIGDVRGELEARLLDMEKEHGGLVMGFSGMCSLCASCSRSSGLPCRHPDRVRPALEAYGFDVCKTMDELFGHGLQWASDGKLPSRLTLVGAFFHNHDIGKLAFEAKER